MTFQAYMEDISNMMQKTFDAWDFPIPNDEEDSLRHHDPEFIPFFEGKYPFAHHRLDQHCWTRKNQNRPTVKSGSMKIWNTPAKVLDEDTAAGSKVSASTSRKIQPDTRRSQEEIRLAQVIYNAKLSTLTL